MGESGCVFALFAFFVFALFAFFDFADFLLIFRFIFINLSEFLWFEFNWTNAMNNFYLELKNKSRIDFLQFDLENYWELEL